MRLLVVEDEKERWRYMVKAVIENHTDWIDGTLKALLDETLKGVVFNNIRRGPERKYFNSTCILREVHDYLAEDCMYDNIFLPTIEKIYTETGQDNLLELDSKYGRFGFTTCYDQLFSQLQLEYAKIDKIDAVVEIASWPSVSELLELGVSNSSEFYCIWHLNCRQCPAAEIKTQGAASQSCARLWYPRSAYSCVSDLASENPCFQFVMKTQRFVPRSLRSLLLLPM